jgi:hypothetical protein
VVATPGSDPSALPTERSWAEKSRGEKLAENADRSLDLTGRLLSLSAGIADQLLKDGVEITRRIDASQLKLLDMGKDVALATISHRLRVEQWAPPEMAETAGPRKINIVFERPRLPEPDAPPSLPSPPEPLQRRPRLDEILAPLRKLDAD